MPAPQVGRKAAPTKEENKKGKINREESYDSGKHVLAPDPKYLVSKLSEINPNLVYFLVYVRQKTESELIAEFKELGAKDLKLHDRLET
jgi:hypothetical protein